MRFALVFLLLSSLVSYAYAGIDRPPSDMRPARDSTITHARRTEQHDGFVLRWGRDQHREPVMCAERASGAVQCFRPGIARARATRVRMGLGVVLSLGGIAMLGTGFAFLGSSGDATFSLIILAPGFGLTGGGIASFAMGLIDRRTRNRGIRWLREHDARLGVGNGLSLSLSF